MNKKARVQMYHTVKLRSKRADYARDKVLSFLKCSLSGTLINPRKDPDLTGIESSQVQSKGAQPSLSVTVHPRNYRASASGCCAKTGTTEAPSSLLNTFTILWKHFLVWETGCLVTGERRTTRVGFSRTQLRLCLQGLLGKPFVRPEERRCCPAGVLRDEDFQQRAGLS